MRIIELLDQRNHYYEKFLSLSERQIELLSKGEYGELDDFYESRESILEIIRYIDSQIGEATFEAPENQEDIKVAVRDCLKIKEGYVSKIMEMDLTILGFIEEAKNVIIQELHQVSKYRKAVNGYRAKGLGTTSVDEVA